MRHTLQLSSLRKIAGAVLVIVLVGTAVGGCASKEEQQIYYDAVLRYAALQKPLVLLKAKPGEDIVLKGVETFAVYIPQKSLRPYQNPWAPVVANASTGVATVLGIWVGGQQAVALAEAVGKSAGTHITNSFNPSANQSPSWYNTGTGTSSPTTTTTTTQ